MPEKSVLCKLQCGFRLKTMDFGAEAVLEFTQNVYHVNLAEKLDISLIKVNEQDEINNFCLFILPCIILNSTCQKYLDQLQWDWQNHWNNEKKPLSNIAWVDSFHLFVMLSLEPIKAEKSNTVLCTLNFTWLLWNRKWKLSQTWAEMPVWQLQKNYKCSLTLSPSMENSLMI